MSRESDDAGVGMVGAGGGGRIGSPHGTLGDNSKGPGLDWIGLGLSRERLAMILRRVRTRALRYLHVC